jgi:hypothetical protein
MLIESVEYLSEADCIARSPRCDVGVISITEPGRLAALPDGWGRICRVQFADAEWDDAMVQRLREGGRRFDPASKGFPSERSTRQILGALAELECVADLRHILVHCHAGKRRSAAVAKFIASRYELPFDHAYEGYNRTLLRLLVDTGRSPTAPSCTSVGHDSPVGRMHHWFSSTLRRQFNRNLNMKMRRFRI